MILSESNIKKLMIIPVLMLFSALFIVSTSINANTIPMSIELKGGTLITTYDLPEGINLQKAFEDRFKFSVQTNIIKDFSGKAVGATIQIDKFLEAEEKEQVKEFLISKGIKEDEVSIQTIGPAFSTMFLSQAFKAAVFAFVFMAVVVFLRFKTFVPSFAVVLSAFSDILTTFAIMILLKIQLSPGSFVALLLLIGYSVDTDILLTSRLLGKKEKKIEERIEGSIKTGLTMSITTIVAVLVLFLVATSTLLREIASVILIGLLIDILNTWIQNAGILLWYVERGGAK